jgi:hypothetical protein
LRGRSRRPAKPSREREPHEFRNLTCRLPTRNKYHRRVSPRHPAHSSVGFHRTLSRCSRLRRNALRRRNAGSGNPLKIIWKKADDPTNVTRLLRNGGAGSSQAPQGLLNGERRTTMANEYCKFCVWFDRGKKWCNHHSQYMKEFDTCNDFKR